LLGLSFALADGKTPEIYTKEFDSVVGFPQYFAASDTVLVFQKNLLTGSGSGKLWISKDAGEKWEEVVAGDEKEEVLNVKEVVFHDFNNDIAFALTTGSDIYYTHDKGDTWGILTLPANLHPSRSAEAFSFTPADDKKIVFNTQHYLSPGGWFYEEEAWISHDGLATIDRLADNTRQCIFARSKPEFKEIKEDRVLCVVRGKLSGLLEDDRLLVSDDYFNNDQREPIRFEGRPVSGIVSIAATKGYLLAAAKVENSLELALFVSIDGETWHIAEFGHDGTLEEDGYTVLESTNYSIQITVQNGPTVTLMSSNSNGTYFEKNIEHINGNFYGYADFEKVQGFQGVVIVNVIDNVKAAEEKDKKAKLQSKISFQDGKVKTWDRLKVKGGHLNLHGVTDAHNFGRVFSSAAPGVMLGVGNKGSHLKEYEDGDLFVSNDAGRNWEKALDGPWKYEFADEGNVLLAIPDNRGDKKATKKASFSVDHGENWKDFEFEKEFEPLIVTTRIDTTGLRILVIGQKSAEKGEEPTSVVFSVDFDKVLERTCGKDDLEDFSALADDEPCIMGHKQVYRRRKRDADCFIRDKEERKFTETICACKKVDFECDFNFVPDADGGCKPAQKLTAPEGQCKSDDDKFKASSGFRLIPGDDCDRKGKDAELLDEKIERPCSDASGTSPGSDKIVATPFNHYKENGVAGIQKLVYLERSKYDKDDGAIMFLDRGKVFASFDHGKKWEDMGERHSRLQDHKIAMIMKHDYLPQAVFFITESTTVFYSKNGGKDIRAFAVPHAWEQKRYGPLPMTFHPEHQDWMIWFGNACDGDDCRWISSLSRDGGDDWRTLAKSSDSCEFINVEGRDRNLSDKESEQLIYCQRRAGESSTGSMELIKSTNFFDDTEVVFDSIVKFATMSEFIIVATRIDDEKLAANVSVSGSTFAPAHFPQKYSVGTSGYTALQSDTHAVFLFVTASERSDAEYGRIMKSNANGTYYVTSIENVNRDKDGFTDFEKVQGIQGVSLVNVVSNINELEKEDKKLQTRITYNDGADWVSLKVPVHDYDGRTFACQGEDCGVHLHSFTEKLNKLRNRRSFSSETAIGLLIGNGNVGKYLDHDPATTGTFMSIDGGIKWEAVGKGKHYWAYGDQGSIVVLVPQGKTNKLRYSLRQGQYDSGDQEQAWVEFLFAEDEIDVTDLTTVPSDNAKNFVIWGKLDGKLVTINIDFSGIRERVCDLEDKKDYYDWSPKHPSYDRDDDCLFGHQSLYHRKHHDADCWNGFRITPLHDILKNCECRRPDFECDYNYERQADGTCSLVPGLEKPDHSQICRDDPTAVEFYEVTGYRRIPLDTCEGGLEWDKKRPQPCAGHEKEFEERHRGLSGFAFFLVAICLPFGAAAGIGYWVYKRWDGKFGAIRLGEAGSNDGGYLDIDKPWVKYPILVLSGLAAVVMAVPGMLQSAWRGVNSLVGRRQGAYTSRASFARNRGDYAVVEDEDELLGDDDDDEV